MSFDCVLGAWREHERELRGYLVHRLGDPDGADDLLQEIFLKSMRQGAGFCEIENPRAWLFQVARNALVDQARLAKPQVEVPDDLAAAEPDERQPVDELDACVQSNLARLCAEDREIIEQCDLGRVRQRAFAEKHGLSLPAAKARLLRARQRLRDALVSNCSVRFDEAGRVCCHVPREGPP
jgi:RNA polymerase sigma-70 factor (ECF subfamily)